MLYQAGGWFLKCKQNNILKLFRWVCIFQNGRWDFVDGDSAFKCENSLVEDQKSKRHTRFE